MGILNHQQECKGVQTHRQYILYIGLLSYDNNDNKPHNIQMSRDQSKTGDQHQ